MKRYNNTFIFWAIFLIPIIPAVHFAPEINTTNTSVLEIDTYQRSVAALSGKDILWLDARKQKDFDTKHIPGAFLLNFENWENGGLDAFFEIFDENKTIVFYCSAGCSSSRSAAKKLREELQQENIYYLKGGIDAWFAKESK
ncbi:MAG: rhodanese-like domain-containing protein [Lentisphaeraceae bacterium]|nr:rhodanese-like domain-containing protein [Lentisphaeraceae bacterium]